MTALGHKVMVGSVELEYRSVDSSPFDKLLEVSLKSEIVFTYQFLKG